jgi:TP53 regulating kinase-like protein
LNGYDLLMFRECDRAGVNVPGIRMVDAAEDLLGIERIEGGSVRVLLPGGAESEDVMEDHESESYQDAETDHSEVSSETDGPESRLAEFGISQGAPQSYFGLGFLC